MRTPVPEGTQPDGRLRLQPSETQQQTAALLQRGLEEGARDLLLEGATGTGKTLTIALLLQQTQRDALLITPNRTLAAQTGEELRRSTEGVQVAVYMSYFDHYQPEAYIPQTDRYIEKDASRNAEIDRMRQHTLETLAGSERSIVVATVSCIYGAGDPHRWRRQQQPLNIGDQPGQDKLLRRLLDIGYRRDDATPGPGRLRVRGDTISLVSGGGQEWRIELHGDEVETLQRRGEDGSWHRQQTILIPPAGMWQTQQQRRETLMAAIRQETDLHEQQLKDEGRHLEAERLRRRVEADLEEIAISGSCPGIENYSRHVDGRRPGQPPKTLLDHLRPGTLLILDESHLTIPQIGGMSGGDRSRKQTLIEYGFRLPSAADNRPLTWEEFRQAGLTTIHMSATPGTWERKQSSVHVEQYLRPTGILDPEIQIRPEAAQLDDLQQEITARRKLGQASLVITLTRRSADLVRDRLNEHGLRTESLHGGVRQADRAAIIRQLQEGRLDAIIGINLLREGLDLPEVSLVAILDASVQGFLRSSEALIQASGRAARHTDGLVIMYADRTSDSMREAIANTERRRNIQQQHNRSAGISPAALRPQKRRTEPLKELTDRQLRQQQQQWEQTMLAAADQGQYEAAADARDRADDISEELARRGKKTPASQHEEEDR